MSIDDTNICSYTFSPGVRAGEIVLDIELKDWDAPGDRPTTLAFYGWVASRVGKPVAVEFMSGGLLIATGGFTVSRPDVMTALGWPGLSLRSGFHVRFSKLALRRNAVVQMVLLQEGASGKIHRTPLIEIGNLPGPKLELTYREEYLPLLITGLGRSGGTLLMGYLATWASIFMPKVYPYELGVAQHLLQAARFLMSPAMAGYDVPPEGLSPAGPPCLGYNPFMTRDWEKAFGSLALLDWHENIFPNRCIDFFKSSIDAFVDKCRSDAESRPKYFVEKSFVTQTRTFLSNVYDGFKEVILVRDFRDVFVSAVAFNRKRGTADFGEASFDNRIDWLRSWKAPVSRVQTAAAVRDGRSLVIRYEDLVRNPRAVLASICDHLQIAPPPALSSSEWPAVGRELGENSTFHMTSADAQSSVGRWRRDLSRDEQETALTVFGDALDYFGYERE